MSGFLDACYFVSSSGTVDFLTDDFTISSFEPQADIRKTQRDKMQMHGSHMAFSFVGPLRIHQEGYLRGFNSDEAYAVARQAMLQVLLGDLTIPPTNRALGTLFVTFPGVGAGFQDVTLDAYPELPMRAQIPKATPYLLTWVLFKPYFDTGGGVILV